MLFLGAGLLAALAAARASEEAPVSVSERFNALNRSPGVAVGGWEARPVLMLRSGYDDNITLARGPGTSSVELHLRGTIDAERDIGPYRVDLGAALGRTWHPEASETDWTEIGVGAKVTFDLKPRLALYAGVSFSQDVERSTDNGIFVDGVFDPYTALPERRRLPVEAGFEYRLADLALTGVAELSFIDFEDQTTQSGLAVAQDFRSGWDVGGHVRTSYKFTPALSLFGEAEAVRQRRRDSQGDRDAWRLAAGGAVEFTRLITGEASAGYSRQTLANGVETDGATYGVRLHWFATELLSLTLAAERGIDAEVVTTAAGVTSTAPITEDRFSLRAEWEPLRTLLVHAEAAYDQRDRAASKRTDDLMSIIAGAALVLTRSLRLEAEGAYQIGESNFAADVERSYVTLGLSAVY